MPCKVPGPPTKYGATGRLLDDIYVEYPPGGLWIGDCEIYPADDKEYATIHICDKHVVLVAWGWIESTEGPTNNARS